jgi:hypothetical protein
MNLRWISTAFVLSCAAACGGGTGTYTVSGTISTQTSQGLVGVPGVLVVLQTWFPPGVEVTGVPVLIEQATTDAQGHYTIATQPGKYAVTPRAPVQSTLNFSPSELDINVGAQNMDHQDFLAF